MSSLQAHLERHDLAAGGLVFRRDCPLCRAERVQGRLPSTSVIPPRTRAAIAAAVLGAATVAPGAAIAADGQGVAVPAPPSPPPPQVTDGGVGDGGAAPVDGDHDAERGSEEAGSRGTDRPSRAGDREQSTDAGSDTGGRPGGAREGSAPSAGPTDDAPAGSDGPETSQPGPPEDAGRDSAPAGRADAPEDSDAATPAPAGDDGHADHGSGAPTPVPPAAPASGGAGAARPSARPPEQHASGSGRGASVASDGAGRSARPAAFDAGRGADRAGRPERDGGVLLADARAAGTRAAERDPTEEPTTYRVRSGDSLWRIAGHRLGSGATATATAQEVTRLWELNRERIGTGNPDLIFPGQTLRM